MNVTFCKGSRGSPCTDILHVEDITVSTSAVSSSGAPDEATMVRIYSVDALRVIIGTTPVPTAASGLYFPADSIEYYHIDPGEKVGAILSS